MHVEIAISIVVVDALRIVPFFILDSMAIPVEPLIVLGGTFPWRQKSCALLFVPAVNNSKQNMVNPQTTDIPCGLLLKFHRTPSPVVVPLLTNMLLWCRIDALASSAILHPCI